MASIRPHRDKWRAQIFLLGVRESAVFRTKREAFAWASARETEIRNAAGSAKAERHTVADALRSYATEVSPGKRGRRWEEIRLAALERAPNFPAGLLIDAVDTSHLAAWRDARLLQVSPGTVLREVALLSAVFETARREWKWITTNPFSDLRRPKPPEHRNRIISATEVRRLMREMKYSRRPVRSMTAACAVAFLFAMRTGARAGEICSLTWDNVRNDHCTVGGKTGVRDVPLTYQAKKLLEQCRGWDDKYVMGIHAPTLDALFRKYRKKAGLVGFCFHDSRHCAATRIANSGKIDIVTMCRIFGWSSPKMAMVYVNTRISDIAKMLENRPSARLVSNRRETT